MIVVPFVIAAVVLAGAGGAVAVSAGLNANSKKAKRAKWTLIGPRMAGKTTWFSFLDTGTIPKGYRPTTVSGKGYFDQEALKEKLELRKLKLQIETADVAGAGGEANDNFAPLREWKRQAQDSDALFFMVDLTALEKRSYRNKANRMAKQVARWQAEKPTLVYLVVTHADRDDEWRAGHGYVQIRDREKVASLRRHLNAQHVFVADLMCEPGLQQLAGDALNEFLKDRDNAHGEEQAA
jgi:GTPase SAR1 family protein